MEKRRNFSKIKRYMFIYQLFVLILAIMFLDYYVGNKLYVICGGVVFAVINLTLLMYYNNMLNKALKNNELFKIRERFDDNLSYDSPVANIIIDVYGKIVWYNNVATILFNKKELLGKKVQELLPDSDLINIINSSENDNIVYSLKNQDKIYDVDIKTIKKQNKLTLDYDIYYTLYFFDVTEKVKIQNKYEDEKTLFGYIYVDNYEEIMNSTEEMRRPMMLGVVERKIQTFAKNVGGTIKKIEKDRFLFILSKESLDNIVAEKFKVLEEVRKISVGNELPITLSIGISLVGDTIDQLMDNAKDATELAVARGGNQAVIKKEDNIYEYYGAKNKQEIDGTNAGRAKSRIKAYALKELIVSVDNVIIMGHKNIDLDALGSALGMARICKELGKNTHIILQNVSNAIEFLYNKIRESDDYEEDVFITCEEALKFNSSDTALIIVDVNIPSFTECPEVIDKMEKVAVIDHHIRGTQFIEKAKVVFLDPFASSASEEVVQMAQYMVEKIKFTESEVDALLAGILVDTKNFMFKTGVKTFEAAAYLRKCGADNIRVKYLFQNDLESFKIKADAIKKVEVYHENTAITVCPAQVRNPYTLVAQIADDLLNIIGIEASFVIYDSGNGTCNISARSNGNINVQIIMESLGGGGHFTAAGVQVKNITANELRKKIKECIDSYFDDELQNT